MKKLKQKSKLAWIHYFTLSKRHSAERTSSELKTCESKLSTFKLKVLRLSGPVGCSLWPISVLNSAVSIGSTLELIENLGISKNLLYLLNSFLQFAFYAC